LKTILKPSGTEPSQLCNAVDASLAPVASIDDGTLMTLRVILREKAVMLPGKAGVGVDVGADVGCEANLGAGVGRGIAVFAAVEVAGST
jgi:hypothetical protein